MDMACSKDFYSNEDENAVNGYCFELVEEDKALECPICLLLLRQTMGTPCSHLFCLVCLQKLTGRRDIRGTRFTCPVCNNTVNSDQVYPIVYMDRCVRGSNVYCQQKKDFGCEWKGTVAEYFNKHENKCEYKIVVCKHEGCLATAMRKILKNHENCCEYRVVQCDHCKSEVKANKMKNHFQCCEKYPMICQENGCNAVIPKNEMGDHLLICDFVTVNCPYMNFGCTEKVVRKNIEKHLEVNTQRHMMLISDKYHKMEDTTIKQNEKIEKLSTKIEKQNEKIEKQNVEIGKKTGENKDLKIANETCFARIKELKRENEVMKTEIRKLKSYYLTQSLDIENQRKEIQQLQKEKEVNIDELLSTGAHNWFRRKKIDFEKYVLWFQKIFESMREKKLYCYDHVMYLKVKIERGKKVYWSSNNNKEQNDMRIHSHCVYEGTDGLVLHETLKCLIIQTETLEEFNYGNSACFIVSPNQQQRIIELEEGDPDENCDYWRISNIPIPFYVDNCIIICLIKN